MKKGIFIATSLLLLLSGCGTVANSNQNTKVNTTASAQSQTKNPIQTNTQQPATTTQQMKTTPIATSQTPVAQGAPTQTAVQSNTSTNIVVQGVSPKISNQTVTNVQSSINDISSLQSSLSQGEQDLNINAN